MSPRHVTMKKPGNARKAGDEHAVVSQMDHFASVTSALTNDGADDSAADSSADGPTDTVE